MRLIFMGSHAFAVPALDALVAAGHQVACVYTQPPRAAGRGKAPRRVAVQTRAEGLGLPVRHPPSLKDRDVHAEFAALGAEAAVVAAYGLILPRPVLDAPARGCLNIHASLLPRWRGAAPIHRAIMAGDDTTGISIMAMEAGLDTGPVLHEESVPIGFADTAGDLALRLADLGAGMVVEVLADPDAYPPRPQDDASATYAAKIDKAEARVDWTRPASEVDRQIRGLSPAPGAWCLAGETRLRLLRSRLSGGQGEPGEVLEGFRVACGAEAVEILEAQRPGGRALDAAAFLRGTDLAPGYRLA